MVRREVVGRGRTPAVSGQALTFIGTSNLVQFESKSANPKLVPGGLRLKLGLHDSTKPLWLPQHHDTCMCVSSIVVMIRHVGIAKIVYV